MDFEKVDQGAHKEGGDDSADSGDGADPAEFSAGEEEQRAAGDDADQVRDDADVFELADLPGIGYNEGNGIVYRYPHVCFKVESGAETHQDDSRDQEDDASGERRISEDFLQGGVGKIHDISDQEHIDESDESDVVPVCDQHEQEEDRAGDQIHGSEIKRNHAVQAAHQGLEGIHAETGHPEQADGKGADHQAEKGHKNSLFLHFQNLSKGMPLKSC